MNSFFTQGGQTQEIFISLGYSGKKSSVLRLNLR